MVKDVKSYQKQIPQPNPLAHRTPSRGTHGEVLPGLRNFVLALSPPFILQAQVIIPNRLTQTIHALLFGETLRNIMFRFLTQTQH